MIRRITWAQARYRQTATNRPTCPAYNVAITLNRLLAFAELAVFKPRLLDRRSAQARYSGA